MLDLLRRHVLGQLGHGARRVHEDRPAAFLHLLHHQVVAQAGAHLRAVGVGVVAVRLQVLGVAGLVVLAEGVHGLGLEQQEPGADRAVAVLEAGRHEAVLHHGQFGAALGRHRVGGAGVPDRVPGAARALADGARPEHVDGAAAGQQAALEAVDVDAVLAHREAGGAGDPRGIVLVGHQAHDEYALLDVLGAERFLGGLGHDPLVGLAVDHDLPAAGAHRLAALDQGLALVAGLFPHRQAPLLEVVHRVVDVPADVVHQVLADDAHQVAAHVAHVVGGVVLAHIGVDRGQALGHGAGAVHGGFVDQLDLQVDAFLAGLLQPAGDLERRAAAGHAAADQQDVDLFLDHLGVAEFAHGDAPVRARLSWTRTATCRSCACPW